MELHEGNKKTNIKKLIQYNRKNLREIIDNHKELIPHDTNRRMLEMTIFNKALRVITKKWAIQILWELEVNNAMIFNELMRRLKKISTRSLSDALKTLQKYKLITRDVQDTRPPSVLYNLTDKGRGLIELSLLIIFQIL